MAKEPATTSPCVQGCDPLNQDETGIPFWCVHPDLPDGREVVWDEMDSLCTFEDDSVQGYTYVQTTPTDLDDCCNPILSVVKAEFSIDGQVESLQNASYDFGSNHANYFLNFDYGGTSYEYDHSSFGHGCRSCQPNWRAGGRFDPIQVR